MAGGNQDTLTESSTIAVTAMDAPPVFVGVEATSLTYVPKQAAAPVTSTLKASGMYGPNLAGATVKLAADYRSSQEKLLFAKTAIRNTSVAAAAGPKGVFR